MISKHSKSRARRLLRCKPERVARQFHRKRSGREEAISKASREWLRISEIVSIVANAKGAEFDDDKRKKIEITVCDRIVSDSADGKLGTEQSSALMLLSEEYDETDLKPSDLAQILKTGFDRVYSDKKREKIAKFLTDHGWMRRAAAAPWLESKGYPLPPQWMISTRSADGPSEENSIATRKTKKPSKLEAWAAEQVKCQHKGLKTELYVRCRDECDGWINKRDGKYARGFSDKTIQRRLDEAAKLDKLDN